MIDHTLEQIGNYRIVRLIDRGGFANVYLGEHIYLGTQVAIKVLATTLTVDERDNFLTEARTIAQLTHPHIGVNISKAEKCKLSSSGCIDDFLTWR